jgi:hypothetical protein
MVEYTKTQTPFLGDLIWGVIQMYTQIPRDKKKVSKHAAIVS